MAGNIFTQAKDYCKKHPRTSFQEAIQIVSNKKKKSTKKKAAIGSVGRKKAVPKKAPRKIKVKVKPGKKGSSTVTIGAARKKKKTAIVKTGPSSYKVTMGGASRPKKSQELYNSLKEKKLKLPHGYAVESRISGISMNKMHQELRHKESLESSLHSHKQLLKQKGLTPGEKASIRRDIKRYQIAIKNSKQHISALKRSI